MCKCAPEIRTPFCGKLGCEWPKPEGVRGMTEEREQEIRNRLAAYKIIVTKHCYEESHGRDMEEMFAEIDSLRSQLKDHHETLQKLDIVSAKLKVTEQNLKIEESIDRSWELNGENKR